MTTFMTYKEECESLRRELENERARDIHSCGPGCTRSGCVNRRLREELAEARQEIADRKADRETGHDQDEATIAELRQQLKDMTERYNVRKELADHLSQQLAASQAREQQLLDTLDVVEDWFINRLRGVAKGGSTSHMIEIVQKAIALQKDTIALESMIAKAGEVMRERCLSEFWHEMSQSEVEAFIRALPAVTLDDLKGGA